MEVDIMADIPVIVLWVVCISHGSAETSSTILPLHINPCINIVGEASFFLLFYVIYGLGSLTWRIRSDFFICQSQNLFHNEHSPLGRAPDYPFPE